MNRAEHLEWAKNRALEELKVNGINRAIASLSSDLSKHEKLKGHSALAVAARMLSQPTDKVKEWIEGFQ